jgi:hypothetical protein
MNGWLLVRFAGIVVGIATLLRVATNEGIVNYDPLFRSWMDWLSDIVELGFLTKIIGPLLHWGVEQVRNLGFIVPDLQDEWRPAFVLGMLIFGTFTRHIPGNWLFAATPIFALVIAVVSGLQGTLEPVAAVAALSAVTIAAVVVATTSAYFVAAMAPITVVVAYLSAAAITAAVAITAAAALVAAFTVGFVGAAVTIVAAALVLIFAAGFVSRSRGWRALFASATFGMGLDILFTMAVAFAIAVAVANPPIW